MKKFLKQLSLIIVFAVLLILFPLNVKAMDYDLNMEFEVNLMDDNKAGVTQKIQIVNNSEEFLSTSMSLDFPFAEVDSLKVVSEGNLLPATIENGRLWLEFDDQALEFGESKEISISYQILNFVKVYGDVRGIIWPKFTIEDQDTNYPVKITYPTSWEDVNYSSQGVDFNVVFDTKRAIAFTEVSKSVAVFFGNYSLKQTSLQLDNTRLLEGEKAIMFPLNKDFYIIGAKNSTNISRVGDLTMATIDIEKYLEDLPLGIISIQKNSFEENTSSSSYSEGIDEIDGIESNDPSKLYKVLLAKLKPQNEISQWSRNNISEILKLDKHSDIDYATVFSEVYRSKKIPTQILYGPVLFPDGNYQWHFWLAYLDKNEDGSEWKQIDPYMEAVSNYESYSMITPVRLVWGTLNDNSDLSDIRLDLFVVTPENFQLRNFTNTSAQTGYITSQLNNKSLKGEVSVLGESTSTIMTNNLLKYSFLYIIAGMKVILISAMIYKRELNLFLQEKKHN